MQQQLLEVIDRDKRRSNLVIMGITEDEAIDYNEIIQFILFKIRCSNADY